MLIGFCMESEEVRTLTLYGRAAAVLLVVLMAFLIAITGVPAAAFADDGDMDGDPVAESTDDTDIAPAAFSYAAVSVFSDLTLFIGARVDDPLTVPSMRFTGSGRTVVSAGTRDGDLWRFEYAGICPQCMSDTVGMELLDGDEVLVSGEYSLRQYFDDIYHSTADELDLNDEQFAALCTLMADILEYGAAAQEYTQYRTSDPANSLPWTASEKTSLQLLPELPPLGTLPGLETDYIKSATLVLSNSVRIRFRVYAKYADRLIISGKDVTEAVLLDECTYDGGAYLVDFGGIYATDFDTVWEVSLAKGMTDVFCWREYSVNSYIASKFHSSNEKLSRIVRAMYHYGVSADMYRTMSDGYMLTDEHDWGPVS